MIEVPGPDVVTSCGAFGRVLEVFSSYVVGIGNPCSPIPEWTNALNYSREDFQLLSSLVGTTRAVPLTTPPSGDNTSGDRAFLPSSLTMVAWNILSVSLFFLFPTH